VAETGSSANRSAEPRASKPAPGLHLVATPIGNLRDITLRALDVLRAADLVACEDTRRTGRLLEAYRIDARLSSYHEHNAARARPALLARLRAGETVALVSDSGTPLVSDPGYRLVVEAIEAGVAVFAVPGPSSLLAALTVSGLPTDRFVFAGFPPARAAARRRLFERLAGIDATLVVFESPKRLAATCAELAAALGERPAAVARELTKLHEEVLRAPLGELAARLGERPPLRGEAVLVVGPPAKGARKAAPDDGALDALLRAALGAAAPAAAARAVAAETGLSRRALYARAVALAHETDGGEEP
jgi:16S rRNA (cytidine1402-2'-O)-methyltransferase